MPPTADESSALRGFLALELPPERIALTPAAERSDARLLVVDRVGGGVAHRTVADLPEYVRPGDVWVLNTSAVRRALVRARKPTGGAVELLFVAPAGGAWRVLGETAKLRPGMRLDAPGDVAWTVQSRSGRFALLAADPALDVEAWLAAHGQVPLPPYIRKARRRRGEPEWQPGDAERYQTVYAQTPGSVAAPTAGLHLSGALLERMRAAGAMIAEVALHVGPATFTEVEPEAADDVRVAPEGAAIDAVAASALAAAEAAGHRVVPVGTTALRTLEGLLPPGRPVAATAGAADVTIRPGVTLRWPGALLTNFHLPRTSLRLLVAAVGGTATMHAAYEAAIAHGGYRFYSYGDAMSIV